jgi:chromosomal replication initiator protein
MLLVDDIHFISGKEQTEESFFHTFNELHNANHQIVLTSDQPPKSISLEERLRSRFEWGLIVDIQPPEFETRLAILKAKAEQREVNIDLDVLEFIAQKTQQNIRELEGSLNRVVAYTKLFQASPNLELATQALKDIASKKPEEASMTPSLVLKVVANSFRLAPTDLKGSRRDKETTLARRVAMYLLRQETSCTVAQVGQELGGRDASAVTNAYKKITNDIKVNAYLKRKISDIQQRLNHQPKSR